MPRQARWISRISAAGNEPSPQASSDTKSQTCARQLGYDVESLTGVKCLLLFTELDQRGNGFITLEEGQWQHAESRRMCCAAVLFRIWPAAVPLPRSSYPVAAQPWARPAFPRRADLQPREAWQAARLQRAALHLAVLAGLEIGLRSRG